MPRAPSNEFDKEFGDLPFLQIRSDPPPFRRIAIAGIGSVLVHFVIATIGVALPEVPRIARAPVIVADVRKAIPLVAPRLPEKQPPKELTQKDPNFGKISHTLDVRSANSTPRPQTPRFNPPPVRTPVVVPQAAPTVIDPPSIEVASAAPLTAQGGTTALPPPTDKPKLTFESVRAAGVQATANAANIAPRPSIEELAKNANRPSRGGFTAVGDELEAPPSIPSLGQAPSPGRMGSNLQLMSDPNGVDFKPYLIQVLAAVRHNWMNVIPESARLGRRGQVLVQFIINRQGEVPKLVIATPSGTAAFDRAAVAGISASYPFPPLPAAFRGDEIRLQLAFSYNMAR
jgi:TonB family protein